MSKAQIWHDFHILIFWPPMHLKKVKIYPTNIHFSAKCYKEKLLKIEFLKIKSVANFEILKIWIFQKYATPNALWLFLADLAMDMHVSGKEFELEFGGGESPG